MESRSNDRMRQPGSGERVVFKPPPPLCDGNWGSSAASVTVNSAANKNYTNKVNLTQLLPPHRVCTGYNFRSTAG